MDLGTYHLRVEFDNGDGYIQEWNTGHRYTEGSGSISPLNAMQIKPTWDSEDDLFAGMIYMYTEGNFSCDCNKVLFLCRSRQVGEPDDVACGDTLTIKQLTAISPAGVESQLL